MLRDKLDVLFARITVALDMFFSLIYFTRATDFAEKEGLLIVLTNRALISRFRLNEQEHGNKSIVNKPIVRFGCTYTLKWHVEHFRRSRPNRFDLKTFVESALN